MNGGEIISKHYRFVLLTFCYCGYQKMLTVAVSFILWSVLLVSRFCRSYYISRSCFGLVTCFGDYFRQLLATKLTGFGKEGICRG